MRGIKESNNIDSPWEAISRVKGKGKENLKG